MDLEKGKGGTNKPLLPLSYKHSHEHSHKNNMFSKVVHTMDGIDDEMVVSKAIYAHPDNFRMNTGMVDTRRHL